MVSQVIPAPIENRGRPAGLYYLFRTTIKTLITDRDFLTGFELEEDVIGRPVDAAVGPDGAVYISDDYAGVIWRVARGEPVPAEPLPVRTPTRRASQASPEQIAAGAELYRAHACATCHEPAQAPAGVVARPLRRLAERYDPSSLAAFFLTPTPPMPRFDLDGHERAALAAYLLEHFGS